ncbi:TPA: hypothetical protein K8E90_003041, partial [Listeria monocytogenes]|nr:hypothetical protein [Listeria monocytogenes]
MDNKGKGRGLINSKPNRVPGNFKPQESYTDSDLPSSSSNIQTESISKSAAKFKNQAGTIKTSLQTKEELQALKTITKTKFDYEIIDLLIDTYVNNELAPEQRRKFKAMT